MDRFDHTTRRRLIGRWGCGALGVGVVLGSGALTQVRAQDASLMTAPMMLQASAGPAQAGALSLQNSSFIFRPVPPESIQRELQLNDIVTVIVDYRSTMFSEG